LEAISVFGRVKEGWVRRTGAGEVPSRRRIMAENSYKGEKVRSLPRANRRYDQGRVCGAEGCGTKLSMYNKWQFCWQHEPLHSYSPRGRRKKREAA